MVVVSLQDILVRVLREEQASDAEGLVQYFQTEIVMTSLTKHTQGIPSAVQTLDLQKHGLGAMLLLAALAGKIDTTTKSPLAVQFGQLAERLLLEIPKKAVDSDPQSLLKICWVLTRYCCFNGIAISAINPLRSACEKLQISPTHITGAHPLLLQACISSKCYKAAYNEVTSDLFELDPYHRRVSTEAVLTFLYYAGIVCLAMKNKLLARAVHFFKMVFAVPCDALSAITLASYKRYILASLLLDGKVDDSPAHLAQAVLRQAKSLCPEYADLVMAFKTKDAEKLKECLTTNQAKFHEDGVLGLVKQVATHFSRQTIRGLTETYVTLSFDKIAASTGAASAQEAHAAVVSMIQKKLISASINQQQGIVSFHTETIPSTSLHTTLERIHHLSANIDALHRNIQLDPTFVARFLSSDKRSKWADDNVEGDIVLDEPDAKLFQ